MRPGSSRPVLSSWTSSPARPCKTWRRLPSAGAHNVTPGPPARGGSVGLQRFPARPASSRLAPRTVVALVPQAADRRRARIGPLRHPSYPASPRSRLAANRCRRGWWRSSERAAPRRLRPTGERGLSSTTGFAQPGRPLRGIPRSRSTTVSSVRASARATRRRASSARKALNSLRAAMRSAPRSAARAWAWVARASASARRPRGRRAPRAVR
jgi:hypothetical protein